MSGDERPVSRSAKTVAIALAILPVARMARIVFTCGENNLSNDYAYRVSLVGSMLDGTCSLGKFIREAWIGGAHSGLAIFPIYYLNARLFGWSVWVELGLGLMLVAATAVLLTGAIPRSTRWFLLPLLSLLLFSTSRVAVLTYGECALQYGLSQLGVAIGVYALAQWRERPIALATALAFGGILASWSWGGGVMTWPVFAIALFALRVRSPRVWTIFLSGAAAGVAQYVWILILRAPGPPAMKVSPTLKIRAILDLLGRPFISGIGRDYGPSVTSQVLGLAGVAVLAVLVLRGRGVSERAPAFVLIGWGLLVAAQVAMFRSELAPWYASPMALFWAGLAVLLALTPVPFRGVGVAGIALLALAAQRTWEDKSFYLRSRTPASAACLREWRTAPPSCHDRVFQWGPGVPGELALLAEPLERRGLSVFAAHRTCTLQGDVALGRVALQPPDSPSFFARDGRSRADADDFRRLDLVLAAGAAATWRVDLPPDTRTARFRTVVRTEPGESFNARGAAVSAAAGPAGPTIVSRVFLPRGEKRELVLDLSRFAGRTVKLSLGAEENQSPGTALFWEAPRIELALEETK